MPGGGCAFFLWQWGEVHPSTVAHTVLSQPRTSVLDYVGCLQICKAPKTTQQHPSPCLTARRTFRPGMDPQYASSPHVECMLDSGGKESSRPSGAAPSKARTTQPPTVQWCSKWVSWMKLSRGWWNKSRPWDPVIMFHPSPYPKRP